MVDTLSQVHYRKVVGRLTALVPDSPQDQDNLPDEVPITATVLFTPSVGNLTLLRTSGASTSLVILKPIPAVLDSDGYLCPLITNADGSQVAGPRGVYLAVTDDPNTNPSGTWTWNVSFTNVSIPGIDTGPDDNLLPGFNFSLPQGNLSDIDISSLVPVRLGSNEYTVQGPPGPPFDLQPAQANYAAIEALVAGFDEDEAGWAWMAQDTGEIWVWDGAQLIDGGMWRGPAGGPKGDPGAAPNFTTVVVPLAPGENPYVTVTGTSPNLTLTFGIPTVEAPITVSDGSDDPDVVWSGAYLDQQFTAQSSNIQQQITDEVQAIALPAGTVIQIVQNADGTYPTPTQAQLAFIIQYLGDALPANARIWDRYEYLDVNA